MIRSSLNFHQYEPTFNDIKNFGVKNFNDGIRDGQPNRDNFPTTLWRRGNNNINHGPQNKRLRLRRPYPQKSSREKVLYFTSPLNFTIIV